MTTLLIDGCLCCRACMRLVVSQEDGEISVGWTPFSVCGGYQTACRDGIVYLKGRMLRRGEFYKIQDGQSTRGGAGVRFRTRRQWKTLLVIRPAKNVCTGGYGPVFNEAVVRRWGHFLGFILVNIRLFPLRTASPTEEGGLGSALGEPRGGGVLVLVYEFRRRLTLLLGVLWQRKGVNIGR
jgi:hypothetical protein